MSNLTLYSVNIAMEATILSVLVIMLVTLVWQKNLFKTTIPLISLTSLIILNIVDQIVTWLLLIKDVPAIYGAMPMRIVYVFDYIFSYGATVAFFYYMEALAIDGYKNAGITYNAKGNIKRIMIIWGVVTSLGYMVVLFIPSIYRVVDGVTFYSIPELLILHVVSWFAAICDMVFIFRHRKIIGTKESALGFTFVVFIAVFFVIDELFDICIGHIIFSMFIVILYVSIDLHKGLLLERREREIVEWKTEIMLSQMQPHFLYNVLTTISSMCEIENAMQARDVVNRFADYFRANLDSLSKERTIPFEKELEHIKTYLWLEKVRFDDALNVCYEIEASDFAVPSLTIQPMVENAVKHGILPKEDGGTVTIRTYETALDYIISVEDDGVGFENNELPDDDYVHIGIENVTKRLELICNGSCEIHSKKGEGTVVTIRIPKGGQL